MSATPPATPPAADPNLAHLHTARTQIAAGDLKNAALTLNKAQQQAPNDPRVFLLAGLMAEKAGNLPGAFDALQRSVALAPEWGPGLLELALLQARHNRFAAAVETADKVAALEPENLQVLAGVIDIAHRTGHTDMAVRHLRRGLVLVPGDVQLRRLLARDLSALEQFSEALETWSALLEQDPADTEAREGRVQTLLAQGQPARARADTLALLEQDPGNAVHAYHNALAHGATPPHQPPQISRALFDGMAEVYDQHMVRGLKYQLPKQVADRLLAEHPDKKINVLDLGCGTGLLGVCLGRLDGALVGVDISRGMIEQAAKHNVYDRFHHTNLLDALEETPASLYQVIAALDVFIYTGDLQQAIPNALRILVPGGQLVFSCETASEDGPDLVLLRAGRYAHKRSHVEALCRAAGFGTVSVEDTVLRQENNAPVHGFLVFAHKPV